jgi:hypothetical protein
MLAPSEAAAVIGKRFVNEIRTAKFVCPAVPRNHSEYTPAARQNARFSVEAF